MSSIGAGVRAWSRRSLGDDCDRAVWYDLRDWIKQQTTP